MKPEKISTLSFCSKEYVSPKQLHLIREISKKMNGMSTKTTTENAFTTKYVNSVNAGECILYNDTFMYDTNEKTNSRRIGKTSIKFNKNSITIDNETGEITKIDKPWYTPIRYVFKKMEKYLQVFDSNFYNDDIVTKSMPTIKGYTPLGLAKIMSGELTIEGTIDD